MDPHDAAGTPGGRQQRPSPEELAHARRARFYAAHKDELRAAAAAWRHANPERAREHNRNSARRATARTRAAERRRANGRAWYAEHADQERERARRFRAEHPERVREYQARYRERHPERAAENARAAGIRWRDRDPEHTRALQRANADRRRSVDPDINRRYYRAHLEEQRERSRANKARRDRLRDLGLPPRVFHRVYANEKRQHQADADAFFTRPRSTAEVAAIAGEKGLTPAGRLAILEQRHRLTGTTPLDTEVLERLDRATTITVERARWKAQLPGIVAAYVRANRGRIREEIRLDNIARTQTGKPAHDTTKELAHRIRIECFTAASNRLVPSREPERLGRLHALMFPRHTAATAAQHAADTRQREHDAQHLLTLVDQQPASIGGR